MEIPQGGEAEVYLPEDNYFTFDGSNDVYFRRITGQTYLIKNLDTTTLTIGFVPKTHAKE